MDPTIRYGILVLADTSRTQNQVLEAHPIPISVVSVNLFKKLPIHVAKPGGNQGCNQSSRSYCCDCSHVIPGIGQVASVAIAGLVAVANAKGGVTGAILAGISSQIPGGSDPTVQAALSGVSQAVDDAANKRPLAQIVEDGISALPIDPNIKSTLTNVVHGIAQGAQVSSQTMKSAMASLPIPVQQAIQLGALTGNAGVVGQATSPTPAMLTSLAHMGLQHIDYDPISAHGRTLAGDGSNGFDIGMGSTLDAISPTNLNAVRNQLSPPDQKGFDMALALHMGKVVSLKGKTLSDPAQTAAYAMTMGMKSAPSDAKAAMMSNIAANPKARPGAVSAIQDANKEKEDGGFFHLLLHILSFGLIK